MKIALVHDWLFHMRGGEKVLEAMAEVFPDATIYTLFYDRKSINPVFQKMKIKASFLQHLPGIQNYYRWLLPFLPWVIKTIMIDRDTNLVISSSHCVAKGIAIPAGARHLCYCHAPMRYLWGFESEYFSKFPWVLRPLIRFMLGQLRQWDLKTNFRVDQFIANSENVKKRIHEFYGRDAIVICPPFDDHFFKLGAASRDYYLVVSAFVPYKKIDLVIEAFNTLDRALWIVGSGPLDSAYKALRKSERISFFGHVTGHELRKLYSGAKALIFPTEEDFGIVPVEAQACGAPVIAFARGGALETVQTDTFFYSQSPEAVREAVLTFEKKNFNSKQISQSVTRFGKERFKEEIRSLIQRQQEIKPAYAQN